MSVKGKGGKGGTAGGGGKSRSGGGSVVIQKTQARQTLGVNNAIVTLRHALFNEDGSNKNVCAGIAAPFLQYNRNEIDVTIDYTPELSKAEGKWAFGLIKETMEERYDASGYGWDDEDKSSQLQEPDARFLVIRKKKQMKVVEEEEQNKAEKEGAEEATATEELGNALTGAAISQNGSTSNEEEKKVARKKNKNDGSKGKQQEELRELVGIVHFRFSVQGEFMDAMKGEPCLIVWDLHLVEEVQRKGLGRHLLMLLELIARRERMHCLCLPLQLTDEISQAWIKQAGRGAYQADDEALEELIGFDAQEEGFQVYTKYLVAPTTTTTTAVTAAAVPVAAPSSTN